MPKLYFYDTGLVCSLLGIRTGDQLVLHPLYGSLFENLIISELKKHNFNRAGNENLFFWRDNTGHEVDILIEQNNNLLPVEIKSGKTITVEFFNGMNYWRKISGTGRGIVVYSGEQPQTYSDGNQIIPWFALNSILD